MTGCWRRCYIRLVGSGDFVAIVGAQLADVVLTPYRGRNPVHLHTIQERQAAYSIRLGRMTWQILLKMRQS